VEFDRDDGNRDKNLRHGVHDEEIEEAFADPRSHSIPLGNRSGEERFGLFGRSTTSGKYLRIVYTYHTIHRGAASAPRKRSRNETLRETVVCPTMKNPKHKTWKIIHSLSEIPQFASEDEEREWWAEHEFSDEL